MSVCVYSTSVQSTLVISTSIISNYRLSRRENIIIVLKGYCTVFQHALKSLEITGIVLSERMSKTARKKSKGFKKL